MNKTEDSGYFEQIPSAVMPLTADGGFRLEMIEYREHDRPISVHLSSPEIDILFRFYEKGEKENGIVHCSIKANKTDISFDARMIFSVFNIHIPMPPVFVDGEFVRCLPDNRGTVQEINRLSGEIKKHLPEILDLFKPEHIGEVSAIYNTESKKLIDYWTKEESRRYLEEIAKNPPPQKSAKELIREYNEMLRDLMSRPSQRVLPRGILGKILKTIIPLHSHDRIIYNVSRDSVDIYFGREIYLSYFIHQESPDSASLYFFIAPYISSSTFIKGREELIRDRNMIVIPARNVFSMLGISYSNETKKGYLASLEEICSLVLENLPALSEAFSSQNIEKTYNALITMDGNNDEEIREIVRYHFDGAFKPPSF
ncbi:MAG: hypothetical protein JW931_07560 [Methanomicrobiaceae archaeon]|nr:hypothetical protein [Methanomicrobiaceae archaeon]